MHGKQRRLDAGIMMHVMACVWNAAAHARAKAVMFVMHRAGQTATVGCSCVSEVHMILAFVDVQAPVRSEGCLFLSLYRRIFNSEHTYSCLPDSSMNQDFLHHHTSNYPASHQA